MRRRRDVAGGVIGKRERTAFYGQALRLNRVFGLHVGL
jgi:hypothetical protein